MGVAPVLHGLRQPSVLPLGYCCPFGCKILGACPSGEIGRHIGLKIRRFQKWGVPVRFWSRAPFDRFIKSHNPPNPLWPQLQRVFCCVV